MKRIAGLALAVAVVQSLSVSAFAQGQLTSPGKSKATAKTQVVKGFAVFAHYNTAKSIESKFNNVSGTGVNEEISFESGGALGLAVRYMDVKEKQLGFGVGLTNEFNREIDKMTYIASKNGQSFSGSSEFKGNNNPKYNFTLLDTNATLGLNSSVYALGGLNYPIRIGTENFDDAKLNPALGWQVGGGAILESNIMLEGMFQAVNMEFESGDMKSEQARLWGILLRGGIAFE